MRRLLNWFTQDLVLASRNSLMLVLVGLILIMGVTIRFALPKEWTAAETYYFSDLTEGGGFRAYLRERDGVENRYLLKDETALKATIKKDSSSIGVLFEGSGERPRITIFHTDRVSNESLNVLKAALNTMVARIGKAPSEPVSVRFLRPQVKPVPLNLTALPGLVAFEVMVLGFMFVAVFIFQEKSEGSIRAYRVSPGGTATYIWSKSLVFMLLGSLYGLGLVVATMGFAVDFGRLMPLMILGINLYTFIGITVAVFFRDISSWLFPGVLLLMANMAPVVSLMFPMFAPKWMTWMPSYPVVFGAAEVLFPSGKSILPILGLLLLENVVAYAVCHVVTHRKMMKEGRT